MGKDVAVDGAGNVYTTGAFSGEIDLDGDGVPDLPGSEGADVFVAKYAPNGDLSWAKSFVGPEEDLGLQIAVDSNANIYAGGTFRTTVDFDPAANHPGDADVLTSVANKDLFVAKLDSAGDFQWARRAGGDSADFFAGLEVDGAGNAYIAGYIWSTVADFGNLQIDNPRNMTGYLAKLDPSGNFLWANGIGGVYPSGPQLPDGWAVAYDVAVANYGGAVYVGGLFTRDVEFESSDGANITKSAGFERDGYLAKYDGDGNLLRVDHFSGSSVRVRALAVDQNDRVLAAGQFGGPFDFDLGPGTAELTSLGGDDVFLLKQDDAGQFVAVQHLGGLGADDSTAIAMDANGQVHVAGLFHGSLFVDGRELHSEGSEDAYLAKLDGGLNLVQAHRVGGEDYDRVYGVAVDQSGMVHLAGEYRATASFPTGDFLESEGGVEFFLAKSNTSAPSLNMVSPVDGSFVEAGSAVSLAADVTDLEDDDATLATGITWASNPDGSLATGLNISPFLTLGNHRITASVTDASGLNAVGGKNITVVSEAYTNSNAIPIPKATGKADGMATSTIIHSRRRHTNRIGYQCRNRNRLR